MYKGKLLYLILPSSMTKLWPYFLVLLLSACVDIYDPEIESNNPKIVVDGSITNLPGPYVVRLTLSAPYNNEGIIDRYPPSASMFIEDDLGNKELMESRGFGYYYSRNDFQAQVGRTYQLKFTLPNGTTYASTPEKLRPSLPIDTVFAEFDNSGGGLKGDFKIYINATDPEGEENYYRWNYTHYNLESYCLLETNQEAGAIFRYACCESCWSIKRCIGCIILGTDLLTDGGVMNKIQLGTMPYDSRADYFVLAEQQSISKDAYLFWKTISEQTSNSGGIFDKPPVTVPGNVFSSDPEEQVLGFFGATAITYRSAYLPRNYLSFPPTPFTPRFPYSDVRGVCVPCEEGAYRTTRQPLGW